MLYQLSYAHHRANAASLGQIPPRVKLWHAAAVLRSVFNKFE